jgi:TatD DNase family protein
MTAYQEDREQVLSRALSLNIKRIVTIGTDLNSSKQAIEIAQKYAQVSATIGVHPHDVDTLNGADYKVLERLCSDYSMDIVGYGEIGLDYVKQHSSPENQRVHFSKQLDLAHELNLPVIIHNRNADDDTLKILRESRPLKNGGIMHCFSGDYVFAEKILDLGLIISIPGIVTFKNATMLQDVAKRIPLSSLVMETDGPFLAPHPFRGKRNEPSLLVYTAQKIADLRQIDIAQVANQSTANAEKLFNFSS